MAATPRRSTRGAIFTPSPHPTQAAVQANTSYHWLSAPGPSSTDERTRYNSFRRVVHHSGQTPRRPGLAAAGGSRKKVARGDEESRFTVGDGVLVGVDGGDGVGVLIGLWQEHKKDTDGDEDGDDDDNDDGEEEGQDEETKGMMAEVHWCFRRQDLPSVMKNLKVEDVGSRLSFSLIRQSSSRAKIEPSHRTRCF